MDMENEIAELVNLCLYEEIYLLEGSGKKYVGRHTMTSKDGWLRTKEDRFDEHVDASKRESTYRGCRILSTAIREHGPEEFSVKHLEFCLVEDAKKREIFWINELDTVHPNGYNLTSGEGDRYTMHAESRQRCAEALRSFGKLGRRNPTAKLLLVRGPNHVGYRGYHNGEPHGFFLNNFTLEEKKDMALAWHLYGELEFKRRLPRKRLHKDENGREIKQAGVKVRYNTAGEEVYHAYHPTMPEVKEKSFKELDDAIAYAELILSFGISIPEEYIAKPRPPRPTNIDLRYIRIKKSKGSPNIQKGTDIGHEVSIPPRLSKTNVRAGRYFASTKIGLDQSALLALAWRDEHLKNPLPKLCLSEDEEEA